MGLRSRSFFDFIAETFFDVIFLIFPSTDFSEKSRIFRKKIFFPKKTPDSNHVFLRWERSSALSRWSVVPNALSRSQPNHRNIQERFGGSENIIPQSAQWARDNFLSISGHPVMIYNCHTTRNSHRSRLDHRDNHKHVFHSCGHFQTLEV